jgi:iron-sulfur cluster repair protein YtfE (RIC family)
MGETCRCGCGHGAVTDQTRETDRTAADSSRTVEATVRAFPLAAEVLRALGIDTCCGGRLTLAEAAASAGISVSALLDALDAKSEAAT